MASLRLMCAALALAVGGCGALRSIEPAEAPAPVDEARPDDVERLLGYFALARKMPAAEQGRERDGAQQAYLRSQTEYNRVRLAMLLSLPGAAFNDEARALELIDPLARNQRSSLHNLAVLLSAFIQEQKRLGGNMQGLQQNVQGLQQKLDALKNLDRNLIEREQSGGKKR